MNDTHQDWFATQQERIERAMNAHPIGAEDMAAIAELSGQLCSEGVSPAHIIELLRSWLSVLPTREVGRD